MSKKVQKRFSRSFDVGARGISGHYATMLGKFQENTAKAITTLALWAWVSTWPDGAVLVKVGPLLTVALVIKIALFIWTVRVWAMIAAGVWYWSRWRGLEHQGLKLVERNDHFLRVLAYRRSDENMIFDPATHREREIEEITVNRQRRDRSSAATQKLIIAGAILMAVPIAFNLIPIVTGYNASALSLPFDTWLPRLAARHGQLNFAEWLSRSDVRGVVGGMSVEAIVVFYVFVFRVVPRLSDLFWVLYDGFVHRVGNQYIPGAKVFEVRAAETTLDTLRDQQVFGGPKKMAPGEAARNMAK